MLPDLACKHALLLQGPAGPFFRRFAEELQGRDVRVTKVNLHGGDAIFFRGPDAIDYQGTFDGWPAFLRAVIEERRIDCVFLFGDCRPYHRRAKAVAEELGVEVWVFEEGYLRPDWITLERGGVNGNSPLPRDPAFYLRHREDGPEPDEPTPPGPSYGQLALYSAMASGAFTLLRRRFPHYRHHRPLDVRRHFLWHAKGYLRKGYFAIRERGALERLTQELAGRYFFVPLQVHCDFQLVHSQYDDVVEFIEEVVATFASEARPKDAIVFKHHPMDRAYREYGPLFRDLARKHQLEGRLFYVHDLHLPTLLMHAKGTITINSTVGISSLHHGTPVHAMGTAIYDMPGLTHQGSLDAFLREPGVVDRELLDAFRRWLKRANQANGSFFRRLPGISTGVGVRWFTGADEGDAPERPETSAEDASD